MEYRRRRANARKTDSTKGGRILAVLIIIAAGIYFVSITSAGDWINKTIVDPVVAVFSANNTKNPSEDDSLQTLNSKGNISIPMFECYMLQMGVFATESNAVELADSLISKGGGGYVLHDGDRYRVFVSGYSTLDEAKQVRDAMKLQGYDCSVHKIGTNSEEYSVSVLKGTDTTISKLEGIMFTLLSTHDDLMELSSNFDSNDMTVEQGVAGAKEIYEQFTSQISDTDTLPNEVRECINSYKNDLEQLSNSGSVSKSEYSSMIKNAQIAAACNFVNMINNMINS